MRDRKLTPSEIRAYEELARAARKLRAAQRRAEAAACRKDAALSLDTPPRGDGKEAGRAD